MVDPEERQWCAEDLVDMMKRRSANHDKAHKKNPSQKSESMLRQGATGPNPRKSGKGAPKERHGHDENPLKYPTVFIPAGRFGKLFQHRRKQALQIQLFIDA